jgi:cytochrome c oxidase assembly factor CtaG
MAAALAATGLGDWSLDAPVWLVAVFTAAYAIGAHRTVTPARTAAAQRGRDACFYGAMVVLVLALASPIDAYSDQLFWVHMTQHVLLMLVAAPLLVISRPWVRSWRVLPLSVRRPLARGLAKGRRTAPLRRLARAVGSPAGSLVLFSIVLLAWHLPGLYDATLSSAAVHAVEHTMFLLVAVLFFKHLIGSPPLRAPLGDGGRVLFAIAGMVVSWLLAVALALAPHPLYSHYAHLAARPGGITALADQQLAAGVMWVPGSVTFVVIIFVYLHRWLTPQTPSQGAAPRLAGGH